MYFKAKGFHEDARGQSTFKLKTGGTIKGFFVTGFVTDEIPGGVYIFSKNHGHAFLCKRESVSAAFGDGLCENDSVTFISNGEKLSGKIIYDKTKRAFIVKTNDGSYGFDEIESVAAIKDSRE